MNFINSIFAVRNWDAKGWHLISSEVLKFNKALNLSFLIKNFDLKIWRVSLVNSTLVASIKIVRTKFHI